MAKNMLDMELEKFGTVPEGNYKITLDSIILKENVVCVYGDLIPKAFMKEIRNKEKSQLTEDQIRQIEALQLDPAKWTWEDGQPKPRFQNKVIFKYHDEFGNSHTHEFFGGPKLNKNMIAFLEQATGIDMNENYSKKWAEIIKPGDEFNVFIKVEGDYNRLDITTIRKVGLPPLPEKEGATGVKGANGLSSLANALLKYMQNEGKGMDTADISVLHTKGLVVDGIALNDFGPVVQAWGEIKKVAKQSVVDNKVDIIL